MVIDGAEAGGGLLRAAMPLCVMQQTPFEIVNLRVGRREPGLGWPHIAVLQGLENSGLISIEGATMGSTAVSFEPVKPPSSGMHVDVNLDDPNRTYLPTDIRVERDYHSVEDTFPEQSLNNWNGRGIRGHAVATPLMALLPLTLSGVTLSLAGGTETPGAPFVDALRFSTLGVVNNLFDLSITVDVERRGAFGFGGGYVVAYNAATDIRDDTQPKFVTYSSPDMAGSEASRGHAARHNIDRILELVPDIELVTEQYDDMCPSINQLLILPQTTKNFARDVSICAEESLDQVTGSAFSARITNELQHREVISRFHIEQVLLWAVLTGSSGSWRTERMTPHIRSIIRLLEAVTDVEIGSVETPNYTEITVG